MSSVGERPVRQVGRRSVEQLLRGEAQVVCGQADGRERRSKNAARAMSSKPTTDTSSGTRRPASRIAAIAPNATTSLATNAASIWRRARSPAIARWPLPASKAASATRSAS